MRAWRHRRSRRSGWVSSAGILSCQVETPLRVFLYSCGTSYLRFRPAAVLQCTACGRVPEQHHRPVGCRWPMRAAQPPGQNHRRLGRMLDGYRVGCWSDAGGQVIGSDAGKPTTVPEGIGVGGHR